MEAKTVMLPTYEFAVTVLDTGGLCKDYEVEASYFQETGQFLQFKDSGHLIVDAFKTESVLRVKRLDELVDID